MNSVFRQAILTIAFLLSTRPAFAIPSPELVIGSVSSLTQLFAIGFAMLTGGTAAFGMRKKRQQNSKVTVWVMFGLIILCLVLAAINVWQYTTQKQAMQNRLQATLLRPAQFDGTKIQDSTLIETPYQSQTTNPLAINTHDANQLLNSPDTLFLDIRETAETQMGRLPNSNHIRFPDITQNLEQFQGKSVVLYCHNGNRSSETCAKLAALGIDCRFIAGGIEKWIVEGRAFTNTNVRGLHDLRAIPDYPNKDKLIDTDAFHALLKQGDLQTIDTRYPADFAVSHLPNAINIPLRALPSDTLETKINTLRNTPTVVACYDRRSCFMGQVLGYELARHGIPFLGRYTTPWDYFIPPAPNPHVQAWLNDQNTSLWRRAVTFISNGLVWITEQSHFIIAIATLALLSRIFVLPIALKSERDQILSAQNADKLTAIKQALADHPERRARAMQKFQRDLGLTPFRNMLALLFLPLMALGLQSVEHSASQFGDPFLWIKTLSKPDPFYALPIIFATLAGLYLQFSMVKTRRHLWMCWFIGVPALFVLCMKISAAGNIYLNFAIILLLIQRAYVVGTFKRVLTRMRNWLLNLKLRVLDHGICSLSFSDQLQFSGNKAYRLSLLKSHGFPVPDGVILRSEIIQSFQNYTAAQKSEFCDKIWKRVSQTPCAVRSSATKEDGNNQSFAGVFDSVLNVTRHDLPAALDQVIASFCATHTTLYDDQNHVANDGNILIQHMIDAEYAGVLFTQDPTAAGIAMIEMVKGSGDDLVSGRKTPQCFRFGRFSSEPIGIETAPIDLCPLVKMGQTIEKLFGCPQDIEWAYADNQFYVVQSRDITTTPIGNDPKSVVFQEWNRIFDQINTAAPHEILFEQDEMSELLPRPTPMSFSIMSQIWRAGGPVDLASRQLGLRYDVPENTPGSLALLFGKTYCNVAIKSMTALTLNRFTQKRMMRAAVTIQSDFETEFLPVYLEKIARWDAIDLDRLLHHQTVALLNEVYSDFINNTYVWIETVNILTSFVSQHARSEKTDLKPIHQLPTTPYSPNGWIAQSRLIAKSERDQFLITNLGHRALFDYEIKTPRYHETPNHLLRFIKETDAANTINGPEAPNCQSNEVSLVFQLQALKEHAKHEGLKQFSLLRKILINIAHQSEIGDAIFDLEMDEVCNASSGINDALILVGKSRHEHVQQLKKTPLKPAKLSLMDCEIESLGEQFNAVQHRETNRGIVVSGDKNISGRAYVTSPDQSETGEELVGFCDGDILICTMLHPAWLSYVLRAGGVICEVGGWLSHMSIIAREKNIAMMVGCLVSPDIKTGTQLILRSTGEIQINSGQDQAEVPTNHLSKQL
ncbi:hypothetical protein BFP76_00860 [Amylibacter kogurei]|uniref:Rhodanese domain-containing protein n=2 Tax=Paramylibacter kogurei TaxID=1889778 RepID=A0A2G5K860_9RHOB|nr:hypothetical protein BFP76_00860 [Amylibacter kogurei]